ncbi:MAG: energy-coupling factor transporter transmembrane protein EcfT [Vallitalea sp.]|jgi:energy-coupling factor transport system permease protein|nr:energy-coupling factor transporter transmembrane protein EcfT [Vallitalea sp.]
MRRQTTPPMDARSTLLILLLANVIAFTQQLIWIEIGFLVSLAIILVLCDLKKQAMKWCIVFLIIVTVQYTLFPNINNTMITYFSVSFIYMRKMLPCLMVGTIIVKKIKMQYLILALRKFHFPQAVLIPLSVTIRYIPSIREEYRHIQDAMKLRNIRGLKRIECVIVPIMISATNTSDELSAAAVTRGIENPGVKTSSVNMSFHLLDYISIAVSVSFAILAILSRGGTL